MSTAESWDLVVPDDEEQLVAELRRHGVRPGKHLFILQAPDRTIDVEGLRDAIAVAYAMAEAFPATHGEVGSSLRTGLEPALEVLRSATSMALPSSESLTSVQVKLTKEQRAAIASMADALDKALRDHATTRRAQEPRPPRRLRFTGMISAEPDLSENFDHYLAQSYSRD